MFACWLFFLNLEYKSSSFSSCLCLMLLHRHPDQHFDANFSQNSTDLRCWLQSNLLDEDMEQTAHQFISGLTFQKLAVLYIWHTLGDIFFPFSVIWRWAWVGEPNSASRINACRWTPGSDMSSELCSCTDFNIFSLFAGDEAASTRQRRLKHRRMVKRLAKDGLASSNRTEDEGNSHIDWWVIHC